MSILTAEPPAHLVSAFNEINRGRASIGKPAYQWSPSLAQSAQELTDWSWKHYWLKDVNLAATAHHDFDGRKQRAGVFGRASESGCGGSSDVNGEDGSSYHKNLDGWTYAHKWPLTHAKGLVYAYTQSNISQEFNEGHIKDFRSLEWTHIGIGWTKGMFAIDYGTR